MSDETPDKKQRRDGDSQKPDKGKRPVRDTQESWVGSSSGPTSRDERRPPRLPDSTHSISTIDEEPGEEPPRNLRHKSRVPAPKTNPGVVYTRSPLERTVWWDRRTAGLLKRGIDPYPEPGASLEQATQTRDLPSEHAQYIDGLPAFALSSSSSSSESASRLDHAEAQSSSDLARKLRAGITLHSTGNRQIERVQEQSEQPEQQTTEQQAADALNTPGDTDNAAVSYLQRKIFLRK